MDTASPHATIHSIPFADALTLQRQLHAAVVAGTEPPSVIFVEHEGVYTAGKRTRAAEKTLVPTIDVDRGGKITWHGPGQLVAYPIVRLAPPIDVVRYVRDLEEAVMRSCARLGVATKRVEGRSGVWVANPAGMDRKLCAIGVRVAQGVSMHGIALNCNNSLAPYQHIVPCGISDAGVSTLSLEAGHIITTDDAVSILDEELQRLIGPLTTVRSLVHCAPQISH